MAAFGDLGLEAYANTVLSTIWTREYEACRIRLQLADPAETAVRAAGTM